MFLKHIIRPPIKDHIITAILQQVEFERDGYVINRSAVKGCVTVLSLLDVEVGGDSVYQTDLEPAILRESAEFYRKEGLKLVETCDAPEFLQRVSLFPFIFPATDYMQIQGRFDSEESRTHHYLSPRTAGPLKQILKDSLLTPHLTAIISMPNSGLDNMIDSDKVDDMARMYRLFTTVPTGMPCLKRSIKNSIARRGKEINDSSLGLVGLDTANGDVDSKSNPKTAKAVAQTLALALKWVQDVLDLKDKFDSIWKRAFEKDRELESGLNEVSP